MFLRSENVTIWASNSIKKLTNTILRKLFSNCLRSIVGKMKGSFFYLQFCRKTLSWIQ